MKNTSNKKLEKKELQNYITLLIIFVVTALIVFSLVNVYHNYLKTVQNTPEISGVFKEIKPEELTNFLLENEDTILYFTSAKNDQARKFEKILRKLVKEKSLEDKFVLVNVTDITNQLAFIEKFNIDHSVGIKLETIPAFAILENGQIIDVLQSRTNEILTENQFNVFVNKHQIKGKLV